MTYLLKKGTWAILLLMSCSATQQATDHQYDNPFDTTDKTITFQNKKIFAFEKSGVKASNQFDGARLNDFQYINDSTYQVLILPENSPINPSPWYAFKIWSDKPQSITLTLNYGKYKHRYRPKISKDGQTWELLDSTSVAVSTDTLTASLKISISPDTLWIAGQEIINSKAVKKWCLEQAKSKDVSYQIIGKSKLGRDLPFLNITDGSNKNKKVIVILSRQHPPEVTGYFAMQRFVERITDDSSLSKAFRKQYRIMVFPLLNPDGVDLGHWRHNAGGIDLNRDWSGYQQPETRLIADFIVNEVMHHKDSLILGLDFHSTYQDVYYTLDHTTAPSVIPEFTKKWFALLEEKIPGYKINEKASGLTRAVSKNWFNAQFKAEGITYEIGDQTERDFIDKKGRFSAEAMMEILVEEK